MFQFPTFAHLSMWPVFHRPGCPIRISRRQGLFAPQPGFSQLITSFIASESQGIHRLPFFYFLSLIDRSSLSERTIRFIYRLFFSIFTLISFGLPLALNQSRSKQFFNHSFQCRFNTKSLLCFVHQCQRSFSHQVLTSKLSATMWRITDSNRWPPACKAGALASWANPPILPFLSSPRQSWTADLYIISVAL